MRESRSTKLDKANVEDILALTPMQEGLLFHYRSDKDKGYYTQQFSARLSGHCSVEAVRQAWQSVARANDVLRTVYRWEKLEKPVQIVLREMDIPIVVNDYSSYTAEQAETLIAELKARDLKKELDLEIEPMRITLCLIDNESCEMILTWHHILFDGWSNGVLLKEFIQTYQAIKDGSSSAIRTNAKTPFKQYVQLLQRQDKAKQRQYWEQAFKGWQERTQLTEQKAAFNEREAAEASNRCDVSTLTLSFQEVEAISHYTQRHEITLAAYLYAAWSLLLGRYCGTEDVLFGTTVSGRTPELSGMEEMIGLFINTVPLRICWTADDPVQQLVKSINNQLKQRVDYELTPLVDINAYSGADSYEPLFNSIMVVENYPLDTRIGQAGDLRIGKYEMVESTHYGLTIGVQPKVTGELALEFAYDPNSFSRAMIDRLANHYKQIVLQMFSKEEAKINELQLLTAGEREELLSSFNRRSSKCLQAGQLESDELEPVEEDVVQLRFERRVQKSPDSIALISGEQSYTYQEIDQAANRLAHQIRTLGIRADEPVAIWLDRSEQLLIAMLAVLKSGAAYVPIDYDYAPGRINQILQDSGTRIVVVDDTGLPDSIAFEGTCVCIEKEMPTANTVQDNPVPLASKARDAAYILYTSGSTGTPKGVVVEHRNLLAYVDAFQHEFHLNDKDTFLQQASCSFDQFVEEVYPVLLAGGQVVIAQKTDVIDMPKLVQLIDRHHVTIVSCSPLLMNELNKQSGMDSVRIFISGGDVLKPEYMSELIKKAAVYNTYGPTEATVCATYHRCSPEPASKTSIPIGKPIWNYRVYVLDSYGHPLPVGVPGEICIAGAGVARGYLNRPDLTDRHFTTDPFDAHARMYRTGDIGLWRSDGSLLYVGRNDQQVKIRGYRVEPGDIEHRLLDLEAIDEAVVLAHQDEHGMMILAAYVRINRDVTANELRDELSAFLPAYMIPTFFYRIHEVPKTSNGKLDRKALLQVTDRLAVTDRAELYPASEASETESRIRQVWQEVLKVEAIGLHEHFFDLGGNSILLMQLHAKLEKEYGWGIQIVDLFSYTTITKLAKWIDEKHGVPNKEEQSTWNVYQQLPAAFFQHHTSGSGLGVVRFHLQAQLQESIDRLALGHNVETFDVLTSIALYLFSELNEQPHASIHSLQNDSEQAVPLSIAFSSISGFEELFQQVHQSRTNDANAYLIERMQAAHLKKGADEVLPLIYRQHDLDVNAAWLDIYDMAWGIEDQADEGQLSISIKFNDKRLKKEAVQMLANGYVDLLRQLTASRVMS
ncbi:non-ribosomal peptide synthetase [Paenibacillus sp. 1001270B_150601_E10]|uniref:non-ribosomal peptide synthetase n=1 Tax=Paenibacillus sp. 1001270B_150601_E10 TaxID=2787079 RepID=UPI00189C64C9|nr:non-ribosomal peptide synthetase [Paenibacillus sp. 1001270B_150601_E10]